MQQQRLIPPRRILNFVDVRDFFCFIERQVKDLLEYAKYKGIEVVRNWSVIISHSDCSQEGSGI